MFICLFVVLGSGVPRPACACGRGGVALKDVLGCGRGREVSEREEEGRERERVRVCGVCARVCVCASVRLCVVCVCASVRLWVCASVGVCVVRVVACCVFVVLCVV